MTNQPFTPEAGLLACLIHKPELWAQLPLSLTHEKFSNTRIGQAYRIYHEILGNTRYPPDAFSWEQALDKVGCNTPSDKLIASISNQIPIDYAMPENIRYYAEAILTEWTKRSYLSIGGEIQQKMSSDKVDVQEEGRSIQRKVLDIGRQASSLPPVSHISQSVTKYDEYQKELRDGTIKKIFTGFYDLDRLLKGLRTKRTYVIAAATGMGKSSFECAIALNIAKSSVGVGIFSLEMTEVELVPKLISLESNITLDNIENEQYELHEETKHIYYASKDKVSKLPLYIEDRASVTVLDIEARIRELKVEKGVEVVMIDHCGLLLNTNLSAPKHENEKENYIALKRIAKDLDVAIIELVQTNAAPNTRQDKEPQLSDLAGTVEAQRSADVVMFIYRDEYYHPETEKENIAEIFVKKNRHGAVGDVSLYWDAQRAAFRNLRRDVSF